MVTSPQPRKPRVAAQRVMTSPTLSSRQLASIVGDDVTVELNSQERRLCWCKATHGRCERACRWRGRTGRSPRYPMTSHRAPRTVRRTPSTTVVHRCLPVQKQTVEMQIRKTWSSIKNITDFALYVHVCVCRFDIYVSLRCRRRTRSLRGPARRCVRQRCTPRPRRRWPGRRSAR